MEIQAQLTIAYILIYVEPQNVNHCPEHQQLIGIRGCERQGNEAGKRLLDIRETKNKRKKRPRSFALSRHRVSSTEVPASLGTRAIGWLEGSSEERKKKEKKREEAEEGMDTKTKKKTKKKTKDAS